MAWITYVLIIAVVAATVPEISGQRQNNMKGSVMVNLMRSLRQCKPDRETMSKMLGKMKGSKMGGMMNMLVGGMMGGMSNRGKRQSNVNEMNIDPELMNNMLGFAGCVAFRSGMMNHTAINCHFFDQAINKVIQMPIMKQLGNYIDVMKETCIECDQNSPTEVPKEETEAERMKGVMMCLVTGIIEKEPRFQQMIAQIVQSLIG